MGKMQRNKGAQYERDIVNELKEIGISARRASQTEDNLGIDVVTDDLAIQCKRGRNYSPINKIEEIQETDKIRVLVTRADRKESMACLPWEDLLRFINNSHLGLK